MLFDPIGKQVWNMGYYLKIPSRAYTILYIMILHGVIIENHGRGYECEVV